MAVRSPQQGRSTIQQTETGEWTLLTAVARSVRAVAFVL